MSWWRFDYYMNSGMVGKFQVKKTSHWEKVDRQYWKNCGVQDRERNYQVCRSLVRLQHALVAAGKCKDSNMILAGELTREIWKRDRCWKKEYRRTPYHEDLLENWGKYSSSIMVLHTSVLKYY